MNRRSFLRLLAGGLVGGVATASAAREWPFRVFSFPSEIVIPTVFVPGVDQADNDQAGNLAGILISRNNLLP